MNVLYRLLYAIGYTPWEHMSEQAPGETVRVLIAQEEAGRLAPFGTALDLGCGSGIWTVALSKRGWDVTGVDNVPKALKRASQRAREADVLPRFVQGDVTALNAGEIGSGFRLVLDFGCFHGLSAEQRTAESRGVTALADSDATILLLAFEPGPRGQVPRGATQGEIEAAFLGWRVEDVTPLDMSGMGRRVRGIKANVYRLRRAAV